MSKPLAPEAASAAEADTEQRLVSALARGVSILRCFTLTQQELSTREIMDMTGLPKPTLFRLLETLSDLGLVRYSERISKYVVGVGMLNLAAPALARMGARALARPLMAELADHLQGQVQMVVGWRHQLTVVEIAQGQGSRLFRPEVGMRMPMARTASGRAYLCSLPQAERQAWMATLAAEDPERHDWLAERLLDAQRDLAEHGFCRGHRDLHREIEGIAAPAAKAADGEQLIFAASVAVFSPHSKLLVEDVGPRLLTLVRSVEGAIDGDG
jgi:DNA-binding IclR family transcriptional regulator